MRYSTQNGLYFRAFKGITDPLTVQCIINNNKLSLERKFYDNDLVCSWSAKYSTNFKGDMLYCKGIGDDSVELERINALFSEVTDNFSLPVYEEYENFYNLCSNSANIGQKIVDNLIGGKSRKLERNEFNIEIENVYNNIRSDFVNITSLKKEKNISKPPAKLINENISDGTLTFMGCCQKAEVAGLRNMLVYKLLEKYYGSGESGTVYSYYRGRGETYLSFSGYSTDENIFYTGIMSGYSSSIYNDVVHRIRNVSFDKKMLDIVKKRLKDDICFSAFQFGEPLTVMPYVLHTGKEVTVSEITDIIHDISINELSDVAAVKKNSLKVVMQ